MKMLKLMIVDDETAMGTVIQRALKGYVIHMPEINMEIGLDIAYHQTGEQALEAIGCDSPDILLLDNKLPGISGMDILAQLSAGTFDLLTVMITAYATLDNAVTATKRGAFDFLAKPFTPDELKSVVKKAATHLLLQRQALRLSEEKRKVRFEFISVLAHELKAPLAAVEQYLSILEELEDKADRKRLLDRSTLRIQGMRKLILDLLDLTRVESGQRKRNLERLDLVHIIDDAMALMKPAADEKDVGMHFHGADRACLMGDRWELETMIANLLSNAVKYNKDHGRVDIDLTVHEKAEFRIGFRDTGLGISPEDARGLFREFSRIRNEAGEGIPGSGLGLSIVKKIASLYQGDIELESTPGRGSTFTLVLFGQQRIEKI
jgi:signal transduction histidine kinase